MRDPGQGWGAPGDGEQETVSAGRALRSCMQIAIDGQIYLISVYHIYNRGIWGY